MKETSAVSAPEKRVFAAICALLVLAVSLPYAWAYLHTPAGFVFSGLLFNPDDQNVHLGWARQAQAGAFFFRDNFTHETLTSSEKPLFTNGLFVVVGRLAALTGLSTVALYHAVRVGCAALALWLFYLLCAEITPDRRVRVASLLLMAFGCGAGWLQPFFPAQQFIDRPDLPSAMVVEAFFFSSAFVYPLNCVSYACLALIFRDILAADGNGGKLPLWRSGVAALVLSNIHTYDVIPLNLALLAWSAYQSPLIRARAATHTLAQPNSAPARAWMAPLFVIACTLPPLLYQLIVFRNSTEFRIKALTLTSAPPLTDLFLSYILLLPLVACGVRVLWAERRVRLFTLWAACCFGCIYLPLSFGRKMLEGVQMPLAILAAAGMVAVFSHLPSRLSRWTAAGLYGAMVSLSSLQFAVWCQARAADNNASRRQLFTPPVYLRAEEYNALKFLDTLPVSRDRALLCLPYLGNYVPPICNRVVFIGHWAETLHANRKLAQTVSFYQGRMKGPNALQWLRKNRIGLVYTGSYERHTMEAAKHPTSEAPIPGLIPLYNRGGVRIDCVPE